MSLTDIYTELIAEHSRSTENKHELAGATVKERNAKLTKLLSGVGAMRLGHYQNNTIDAFGDAYEYLMGMYASNAGKSGGEYYTP